jgi:glycosyltransferase involved in cell wall biosynthesis
MVGRKKIVIITYSNFPFGGPGANLIRHLAKGLYLQNNEIEVLLPTGNFFGKNIYKEIKRAGSIDNIKYRYLCFLSRPKSLIGKFVDTCFGTIMLILHIVQKNFNHDIDLIISYNTSFISTSLLSLTCKIINKKFILILPEFYEKPKPRILSFSLLNWYSFFLGIRYSAKGANSYIVLSSYLKNYLNTVLKNQKPVLVMPNIIDSSFFNVSTEPFIKSKITIGYTGTPTKKDGIEDLIYSFHLLHQKWPLTHLLIIGDVPGELTVLPRLKELANKLGLSKDVTFTGLVSHAQIPFLLQACQILALTRPSGVSAEAGFPTKIGEYFACKKPVVVSCVGDIAMYFKNEEHVMLVIPSDITSMSNAFEKLIINNDLVERLIRNSFQWMEQNLDYRIVGERVNNLIEISK